MTFESIYKSKGSRGPFTGTPRRIVTQLSSQVTETSFNYATDEILKASILSLAVGSDPHVVIQSSGTTSTTIYIKLNN